MATKFNCSGEAAADKAASGDAVPEIIVRDFQTLIELNDDQLDHVSLGLENAFGVVLFGDEGGSFSLDYADGSKEIADETTVAQVWQLAKELDTP